MSQEICRPHLFQLKKGLMNAVKVLDERLIFGARSPCLGKSLDQLCGKRSSSNKIAHGKPKRHPERVICFCDKNENCEQIVGVWKTQEIVTLWRYGVLESGGASWKYLKERWLHEV